MQKLLTISIASLTLQTLTAQEKSDEAVGITNPPYAENLDTLVKGEWWKVDARKALSWNKSPKSVIADLKVERKDVIAFGIYTLSNSTLKISAQLFPLYPKESKFVHLEIKQGDSWKRIATQAINTQGWSAQFRIPKWDDTKDVSYRIRHGAEASFAGTIRKNPRDKESISIATLSCNSSKDRGPRSHYVRNINHQDPDLVFFAGDQYYGARELTADWLMFGLQFREIFRHRPCITILDDHDVGHGNLWGEGGRASEQKMHFNDGGYRHSAAYVNAIQRFQTGHLPDPYDPTPVKQGITVYYTSYNLGGVDLAILEDRKFKSAPLGNVPKMGKRIDMITSTKYKPQDVDKPGLKLLGDRQIKFLEDWSDQWDEVSMKAVLSQTPFCNASYVKNLRADLDSNGWPQTARNKAIALIDKANAIHISGDQHLATLLQHNTTGASTGPWAFSTPAVVNTVYKRYWKPVKQPISKIPGNDLPFSGHYKDSFDHDITMHAYANPEAKNKGEGYGMIRFNKKANTVTFECWPRRADVTKPNAKQYKGWPRTVKMKSK